jgi:hypothetical protein
VRRLKVDLMVLGYTLGAHRWQIALVGLSLIAKPNLREALKYDPLADNAAARLAAALAGYEDVDKFIREQQVITDRLTRAQQYWKLQR